MAKSPFRPGQELGGLGEHVGNPRRYVVSPTSEGLVPLPIRQEGPPAQELGPGPASERMILEDERQQLQYIRSLIAPDDHLMMSPRQLGSVVAERIDVGIKNRTSIMIANMSNVVVWVFTASSVVAGQGWPLAANAPAGAFNGGTLAMDLSERVEFWAIAAAGVGNLVVVLESAR